MAARVEVANEVSINSVRYKTTRRVQSIVVPRYAPKFVTGDISGESLQGRSVVQWSDNTGGVGRDRITDVDAAKGIDLDRCWYSSAYLRHKRHLTLPPLVTATAASGVSGVIEVGVIGELSDSIYASFYTSMRQYSVGTDTWTSRHTLPAEATDVITVLLGGTTYLVVAHTGGYSYTSNGTSWTDDTTDVKYLAFWDNRLWGIDQSGQLWFAQAIGTDIDDAQLELPNDFVTDLFVDRDAAGEPILYAATKQGVFAHDVANKRFVATELDLPFHNSSGQGVKRWRGATYYPAGLGVYRYQPGGAAATVSIHGPDRDDGLPNERKGTIIRLEGSHNELLALVDSTSTAAEQFDVFTTSGSLSDGDVIDPAVGVSLIMGWDTRGWQVLWESEANTEAITYSHVSNADGGYRLWFGHNRLVHYMDLPVDVLNPNETASFNFASSATHEYPWLLVGEETNGLALRINVHTARMSSTETVAVSYATDLSESYTSLGTITSDGITTYKFPDSTTPTGTQFRAIRPKLTFARGSDSLKTPDVTATTFEFRKKLTPQYSWQAVLDLNEGYGGRSPNEWWTALRSAVASQTLVEFTFRNDTGDTRNYYVDVTLQGEEETGADEAGTVAVTLAEV